MALKCADIGNLAQALPVHMRWVMDLEQEFFLQVRPWVGMRVLEFGVEKGVGRVRWSMVGR